MKQRVAIERTLLELVGNKVRARKTEKQDRMKRIGSKKVKRERKKILHKSGERKMKKGGIDGQMMMM